MSQQDENTPNGTTAAAADEAERADAAGQGGQSAGELEQLRTELEATRQQAQENWERYLREAAELQNLRKRATEREEKARKFAVDRFAGDMLNVKDSLEMGLAAAASDATVAALREGMEATLRQLEQAFSTAGLREVDPNGEPFDPARHEAMGMQELAGLEREEVVTVVQKGYLLHERVLRPARVIVGRPAAGGAAAEAQDAGGGSDAQSAGGNAGSSGEPG